MAILPAKLKTAIKLPVILAQKALNNRDLIDAAYRLAAATDDEQRRRALEEIGKWQEKKMLDPERVEHLGHARGVAAELLKVPWVVEQLTATPHLGLLAEPSILHPPRKRLDYVGEIVALADAFREANRGIGLNSAANVDARFKGKEITDLELIQVWAILQSASHLFGTFATERALLFTLKADSSTIADFKKALHPELRDHIETLLSRANMYSFVRAMMAWRVSRHLDGELADVVRRCLCVYLDRGVGLRQRELFKRLRQLAYLRMQSRVGVNAGVTVPIDGAETINQLLPDDGVAFQPFDQTTTSFVALLNAVDAYQYSTFFTSDRAAEVVLAHLREFKKWWAQQSKAGVDLEHRVDALFRRPGDWQSIEGPPLTLTGRVFFALAPDRWYDEARSWWADGAPWAGDGNNFYLSHAPNLSIASVNLYGSASWKPESVHHVTQQLLRHSDLTSSAPPSPETRLFWRSLAVHFARHLSSSLVEPRSIVVDPVDAHDNRIGYIVLAPNRVVAIERVTKLIEVLKDSERATELRAVVEYLRTIPDAEKACWVVFVAKLRCHHENGATDGDLDGVIGCISSAGTTWHLAEVKTGGQTPGKQARKTARWFGRPDGSVSERKVPDAKLAVVTFQGAAEASRAGNDPEREGRTEVR